jgi:hypothetical protein
MEVAMNSTRVLAAVSILACAAPAFAAEDEAFGHALTLVQMFVRVAAQSEDPKASLKAIDDVLAGRNTEANRAFAGLLEEATADMSSGHRDQVASIARDLAATARKEIARPPVESISPDRSLQARKDLTAMGLRYYDNAQFLDAVKRDDALAVELYLIGRGVNASAKGPDGRGALDIARANKNDRLAELLARNLP